MSQTQIQQLSSSEQIPAGLTLLLKITKLSFSELWLSLFVLISITDSRWYFFTHYYCCLLLAEENKSFAHVTFIIAYSINAYSITAVKENLYVNINIEQCWGNYYRYCEVLIVIELENNLQFQNFPNLGKSSFYVNTIGVFYNGLRDISFIGRL